MSGRRPVLRPCTERERLIEEFRIATRAYADRVDEMSRQIGILPQRAYRTLQQQVEEARLACEAARVAVEKHRLLHGCEAE